MTLQAQKSLVIEQFKQVNDINLIMAIQSMLEYARTKSEQTDLITADHKKLVRHRIKTADKSKMINWDDNIKNTFRFK